MPEHPPLPAHSITEARFYLRVNPCPGCREGRLRETSVVTEEQHIDHLLMFECVCERCGQPGQVRFRVDGRYCTAGDPPAINAEAAPSRIIDVAQWLTLCHGLMRTAAESGDRQQARLRSYEAALCLDEALKFFDADNDLPPHRAFFDASRRQHARGHPRQFARAALLDLRQRLPECGHSSRPGPGPQPRPWWRLWK